MERMPLDSKRGRKQFVERIMKKTTIEVYETVHETHTANKDDEAFNTKSNDSYIEFFELRFRLGVQPFFFRFSLFSRVL